MIRQAGLEELDRILDWRMEVLSCVFSEPEEEIRSKHYETNRQYFASHLEADKLVFLFTEEDGQPVGCAAACLQEEMPSPDNPSGKNAYIMNVYVRQQERGEGLATELIQELITILQERGVEKIYLETTEMGRRLYADCGFTPMKDYMIWKKK